MILLVMSSVLLVSLPVRGLRHERKIAADSVAVGEQFQVSLAVYSKARTARLLHFEEVVPRHMGVRPRFSLSQSAKGAGKQFSYTLTAALRGHHQLGPLLVRSLDPFGLASHDMAFNSVTELAVTPQVHELGSLGMGSAGDQATDRASAAGLVGADDVLVRDYRPGDEVRRVHWRSTARTGQLMVRREEQSWSPATLLLLDNRAGAHAGTGMGSSFEWAVSAAASVGVGLIHGSARLSLACAEGVVASPEGSLTTSRLLNQLTDIALVADDQLPETAFGSSGIGVIAVLGKLDQDDLSVLASVNTAAGVARAILLDVGTFAGGNPDPSIRRSSQQLAARGWQVTVADCETSIPLAWEQLNDPAGVL